MRQISVRFETTTTQYSYLTTDPTIKVGDECVVITPTGTKIVTVMQVDTNTGKATKPIVCKVDKQEYEKTVQKMAEKAELKRKIDLRVKELTEGAMLRLLAERDSELAALLKQQESI